MEFSSSTQRSQSKKARLSTPRRTWTFLEEQCLIGALKEIVIRGWKSDNGFKTGFLGILEKHMAQSFPLTDLKADPHINSKIHVWKKLYGSLSTMLSRSGFGWNDASNTLEVIDDQVWIEYVKSDPGARTMRYKAWPFYKDWVTIFGKDRATGENVEVLADVVNDLMENDKGKEHMSVGEDYVPFVSLSNEDDASDFMSQCGADSTTTSKMKKKSKKRPLVKEPFETEVMEMMRTFFDKTGDRLGDMVKRMGFEHDAASLRKGIFKALEPIPNLNVEDKLNVAKHLCLNKELIDIFFGLSDEHKAVMVKMIHEGRY